MGTSIVNGGKNADRLGLIYFAWDGKHEEQRVMNGKPAVAAERIELKQERWSEQLEKVKFRCNGVIRSLGQARECWEERRAEARGLVKKWSNEYGDVESWVDELGPPCQQFM